MAERMPNVSEAAVEQDATMALRAPDADIAPEH
jgi:hypothetical protein